jgi:hypothetical protein
MKRSLIYLLVAFVILSSVAGCKEDSETSSEEAFTLIAEQQIGAAGGTIGSAGYMFVDIPSGAFNTTVNIKMYSSDGENPFKEDGASGLFYLDGLPGQFTKPIRISIKHDGTVTGGTFINQAKLTACTSTFDTIYGTNLIQANDSAGYLVAFLPVLQTKDRNVDEYNDFKRNDNGVQYSCVKGLTYRQSAHFIIYHRNTDMNDPGLAALNDGLEAGYQWLASAGFEVNRLSEPVDVYLKYLKEEIYGQTNRGFPYFTDNSGYIEINRLHMMEPDIMKITGGHEFFHIVQDLYNYDEKYNWLQEASSTWFEAYLTSNPLGYIPITYKNNKIQSFYGLQRGISTGEGAHGYGCAAVMKYQMSINNLANDPKTILEVWKGAQQGKEPVEAIQAFPMKDQIWYPEFLKKQFLGQLYDDEVFTVFNNIYFKNNGDTWDINTEDDNEKEFNSLGWDMSGEVFQINPLFKQMPADSKLVISLEGDEQYLYAFRYDKLAKMISLAGESASSITIDQLKDYAEKGDNLYLLLATYAATPPHYNGTNPAKINLQVMQRPLVSSFETTGSCVGYKYSGSFKYRIETDNDYKFTVTRDEMYVDGGISNKWIELDFDPPPAGQLVTFNIYLDTLSLASQFTGTPKIVDAGWSVNDMLGSNYIALGEFINNYHVTAQYSSSVTAGPTGLDLKLETSQPGSASNLLVFFMDFNMKKE